MNRGGIFPFLFSHHGGPPVILRGEGENLQQDFLYEPTKLEAEIARRIGVEQGFLF